MVPQNRSKKSERTGAEVRALKIWLTPIFVLALLNSMICWTAAWMFRDRYEFAATLLGFGGMPIVVAVCAYLFLLTRKNRGPDAR